MRSLNIIQKIRKNYPNLSFNQKKISAWLLDNSNLVPFLTVQTLAENINVSTASIVRYCQKIEFDGFPDMKDEFIKYHHERTRFTILKNTSEKLLQAVPNQDINIIKNTFNRLDSNIFDQSIKTILKAQQVYVCGLGISYLAAQILTYQLNQVGIGVKQFDVGTASFIEQLIFVKPEDCIIAFSFQPYSKETIDLVKKAHEMSIKTISICDSESAPVTYYSTLSLLAESENILYINSLTGIVSLINTIVTACTAKDKSKAEAVYAFQSQLSGNLNND